VLGTGLHRRPNERAGALLLLLAAVLIDCRYRHGRPRKIKDSLDDSLEESRDNSLDDSQYESSDDPLVYAFHPWVAICHHSSFRPISL